MGFTVCIGVSFLLLEEFKHKLQVHLSRLLLLWVADWMIGQPFRTCDLTGQKLLPLKYVMECVHMHMFAGSGWDRRCVMAGAVVEDKTESLQRAEKRSL